MIRLNAQRILGCMLLIGGILLTGTSASKLVDLDAEMCILAQGKLLLPPVALLITRALPRISPASFMLAVNAGKQIKSKKQEARGKKKDIPAFLQDDAWYVMQLLAQDSQREEVQWLFGVLENPAKHPLVRVEFSDTLFPAFVTEFDAAHPRVVFRINRGFIRASDPSTTSLDARAIARLLFVREAALAKFVSASREVYEEYMFCALKAEPDAACFFTLRKPHLGAVIAQVAYAKEWGLMQYFPKSLESVPIPLYLHTGDLPNMFWAPRYAEFF